MTYCLKYTHPTRQVKGNFLKPFFTKTKKYYIYIFKKIIITTIEVEK